MSEGANIDSWAESTYGPLGKTTDEILSHAGHAKLSNVLGAIRHRIWQKVEANGIGCLSRTEEMLLILNAFVATVFNGGFEQYFYQSTGGNFPREALEGLRAIGANISAGIMERAMAVFPSENLPAEAGARERLVDELLEQAEPIWKKCDDDLYDAWQKEHISELTLAYVLRHRTEIVLVWRFAGPGSVPKIDNLGDGQRTAKLGALLTNTLSVWARVWVKFLPQDAVDCSAPSAGWAVLGTEREISVFIKPLYVGGIPYW